MLVLTRKVEESVLIGENIEIKVLQVKGSGRQASIRLGITAPEGIRVLRKEVLIETAEENRRAAQSPGPDLAKMLDNVKRPATKE
jgi:carbon storage regulator